MTRPTLQCTNVMSYDGLMTHSLMLPPASNYTAVLRLR